MDRATLRISALLLLGLAASGLGGCGDAREDAARRAARNQPIAARLAVADPARGKALFGQCAACHSIGAGMPDRNGPNLHAILGKPVAGGSTRFGYTAALSAIGGRWDAARMDAWLADPARFAPGTAMQFAGLPDPIDRADVIAYLGRQRPAPPAGGAPTRR